MLELYGIKLINIKYVFVNRERPTACRANDYNHRYLLERYMSFLQEMATIPTVLDYLHDAAERDPIIRMVRGALKLTPGKK